MADADLSKSIRRTRFPWGMWTILTLPYAPIGGALCLLRLCLGIQVVLLLLIFPEGVVKRYMLRVFFTVLGILVITDGELKNVKLMISNKVSFADHIVLHMAARCVSVSTGGSVPPLATLFPHWTFPSSAEQPLLTAAKALPEFQGLESAVEFSPYAIQPEPLPTNGQHILLKFSKWPFSLRSPIQPVALSVLRPFPVAVSTVQSSGWWDFMWMLYVPITIFHVRFLPILEPEEVEEEEEEGEKEGTTPTFAARVQQSLASALKVQSTQLTQEDVKKWLTGPRVVHTGPIISPAEFDPSQRSPQVETMIRQVTAVLPQVPLTAIRKDLLTTNNVDATITNLLEGRVKYSVPSFSNNSTSASQVFRRKVALHHGQSHGQSSAHTPSLQDRKKDLLQNARRKYMEKHGL